MNDPTVYVETKCVRCNRLIYSELLRPAVLQMLKDPTRAAIWAKNTAEDVERHERVCKNEL